MLHNIGVYLIKTHVIPLILLTISAMLAVANPHKLEIMRQNLEVHQLDAISKGAK